MKKNWLPIALLIAFIIGYNAFVIAPYTRKQKEARDAQSAASQVAAATTPTAQQAARQANGPVSQNAATGTFQADGKYTPPAADDRSGLLNDEVRADPEVLNLSSKRAVSFFKDGTIGAAVFQDYFEREKNIKTPIVLSAQGFRYTATDSAVANCLNTLKVANRSEANIVFKSQTPLGSCSLEYNPDPKTLGRVQTTLSINGFNASHGTIEVKSIGEIGKGPAPDHNFLAAKVDGSQTKVKEKKLFEPGELSGKNVDWMVWGDRYFESTILPTGIYNPSVFHVPAAVEGFVSFGLRYPIYPDGASEGGNGVKSQRITFDYFFGTRDTATLSAVKPGLEESIEFGWFRGVSTALLWCLNFIYQFVHNYGLAIIILTLVVRMAFWPLNKRVFSSSQKMKTIQPQIEAIKKKYSDKSTQSQQALNMETLALYRKHGVNPVGSCLPLLLQMPIFLGLYGALNHSMALYQAPFFGWVQDLSSKDPFYIFPVLWTLSLLGYVQLNPTPQQSQPGMPDMKWIMAAMNVFFGYLSKDWPAGLTLYLFVSNLVGISQQLMMRRQAQKLQPIQEGA